VWGTCEPDYARFKADHIAFEFGDESLVYPTTPAFPQRARRALKNLYSVQPGQFRWVSPWWYATSFAYLLLVCDLYLALPLLVCKLGWRRRVYEHRVYDADPYTYHAFRIRPKTPPSDIVAAALHVAYAAAVAAWARCANPNPWISVTLCVVAPLFLVLVARDVTYAAITKFYPWGRRRYAQQDHDESSARDVIILSTAAQTCADAFFQVRACEGAHRVGKPPTPTPIDSHTTAYSLALLWRCCSTLSARCTMHGSRLLRLGESESRRSCSICEWVLQRRRLIEVACMTLCRFCMLACVCPGGCTAVVVACLVGLRRRGVRLRCCGDDVSRSAAAALPRNPGPPRRSVCRRTAVLGTALHRLRTSRG